MKNLGKKLVVVVLVGNVLCMKSWLAPTFQNAINFDSQFFIYGVIGCFYLNINFLKLK